MWSLINYERFHCRTELVRTVHVRTVHILTSTAFLCGIVESIESLVRGVVNIIYNV